MADFLEQLNDSQRAAVEYCNGPALVIAGAGSGKTRVLTYKIAYLLDRGMNPWNVLALTFTNKAATEMKNRIAALVGEEKAGRLNMGTFHSVFSRILRVEAQLLGYENNFTIYDESDSRSLLKTLVKEMSLDDKLYKPSTVHARISRAKNHLVLPGDYCMNKSLMERDTQQRMPRMAALYAAYCSRLKMANAMDFDDLLTNTYRLLTEHEDIRQKYAARYQYILVDEYQDTNAVQQKIVWLLCKDHLRVCAVGDDAQSIYAFRGANIDNILDFREIFTGTQLFKLEQNYRSTQRIVQAANSVIRHNERQIPKDVYSKNDQGDPIVLKPAYSDREEAIIVCNEIKRIRNAEHCEYADFAVLYRTNSQSRSFEEAMLKVNIPYRIYGGLGFYQRKEVKDILAYFRLVANLHDEEAFKRIVNYPKRGIGDTTVAKVSGVASVSGVSLWETLNQPERYGLMLSKATLVKLQHFKMLIEGFAERFYIDDAYTLAMRIVKESGMAAEIYADRTPENLARQENVEELLGSIQEFVEGRKEEGRQGEAGLADFLQEVSLQTTLDSEGNDEDSRVSLMTVHSAKGLEFGTVFIVGLEENIFPSLLSMGSRRELEEERRLLYVAMTRAERHCIITYAQSRYRYGRMETQEPSRFIRDIAPELLRIDQARDIYMKGMGTRSGHPFESNRNYSSFQNSRPVATQFKADPMPREVLHREQPAADDALSPRFKRLLQSARSVSKPHQSLEGISSSTSTAKAAVQLSENCVIEHERFGVGKVLRVEGSGENTKATVQFSNVGVKQLLLKFARFKVIG